MAIVHRVYWDKLSVDNPETGEAEILNRGDEIPDYVNLAIVEILVNSGAIKRVDDTPVSPDPLYEGAPGLPGISEETPSAHLNNPQGAAEVDKLENRGQDSSEPRKQAAKKAESTPPPSSSSSSSSSQTSKQAAPKQGDK